MDRKSSILVLLLIFCLSSCADDAEESPAADFNETRVSGVITTDTLWKSDDTPHIMTGDVTIPRGTLLVIEPGVEVRLAGFYALIVKGALIANGEILDQGNENSENAAMVNSIVFTSNKANPEPGDWAGIQFDNTIDERNSLSYITVKYAKIGIDLFFAGVQLRDTIIEENETGIATMRVLPATYHHNLIRNNRVGANLSAFYVRTPLVFEFNVFTENEIGVQYDVGAKLIRNNLYNNLFANVVIGRQEDMLAPSNWWGTTDADLIEASLRDGFDSAKLGRVLYQPIAPGPIADTGPRAP